MARWKYLLLPFFLLLVACSSEDSVNQETAGQPSFQPVQNTATPARPTEEPSPEPQNTQVLPNPAEGQAGDASTVTLEEIETATAVNEIAESQQAAETPVTETPPTATAMPEINGKYEGTFYRGLATAPITMIDYSDFL